MQTSYWPGGRRVLLKYVLLKSKQCSHNLQSNQQICLLIIPWISTLIAQHTLLSVKMLHGCGDCHIFFSFPCIFNTKKQLQHVRKTKRHDIFVNYWLIFSVGSPLTAKIFTLGNTCTCISSISHWMFGFQTRSNSFEWKSLMQLSHSTKPTHQKKLNRSFDFWSQSNIELGYQTKWNSHKEHSNGTKTSVSVPSNWWQVC